MKIAAVVLGAFLIGAAPPTNAPEWWVVSYIPRDRTVVFVDRKSISGAKVKRAWKMFVSAERRADAPRNVKELSEYDCGAQRYRMLTTTYYEWDGRMSTDTPDDVTWRYAPPGTMVHNFLGIVCDGVNARENLGPVRNPLDDSAAIAARYETLIAERAGEAG